MRNFALVFLLLLSFGWVSAQTYKPYIKAFETTESVSDVKGKVVTNLEQNGISVVGQYKPAGDANRWIIVFSAPELENAVKKVGGLTGFAAALRIGITREGSKTIVSYTDPYYWGNAYFRGDYDKVSSYYTTLNSHLEAAMKASGAFTGTSFGSKDGMTAKDLRGYHYMFGMPYFDDTEKLATFDSHQAAVDKIEASLRKGVPNVTKVYKVKIPGQDIVLYGFGLSGDDGESKFMPIIDIGSPKHTAFLPYELLVVGKEVHMLHGRFRIALSFPDLTMGTFTKIMSTPGDIEDMLEQLVK
jgi:hypothetical protein